MADKEQIIIDGVDISRCEHWNIATQCELSQLPESSYKLLCKDNPDCYFKQLARKTQECEELKKRATIAEDNFACEVQARLYHQNKWLKFSKEVDRYRKALEEIKEYFSHTDDPHMLSVDYEITAPTIIDIISKARGEE